MLALMASRGLCVHGVKPPAEVRCHAMDAALSIEVKCPRIGLQLTTRSVAVTGTSSSVVGSMGVGSAAGGAGSMGSKGTGSTAGASKAAINTEQSSHVLLTVEGVYIKIPDFRHLELEVSSPYVLMQGVGAKQHARHAVLFAVLFAHNSYIKRPQSACPSSWTH